MSLMRRLRLVALGAALAYFFDPDNGPERRKAAIKKVARAADGVRQKVGSAKPEDEQLARKVEAELFTRRRRRRSTSTPRAGRSSSAVRPTRRR